MQHYSKTKNLLRSPTLYFTYCHEVVHAHGEGETHRQVHSTPQKGHLLMIHIKDMWKEQEITRLRETIEAIFQSLIQTPP